MDPSINPWLMSVAVCAPLYYLFWKFIFGSWGAFFDSIRYWFQPNWMSAIRGEFGADFYASLKLFLSLLLCSGSTLLVFRALVAPIES